MADKYSLIVLSNRLPFVLRRDHEGNWQRKPSAGGLVTAVAPVVIKSGGRWVGWTGVSNDLDSIPESSPDDTSPTAGLKSEKVVPVELTEEDHELYYNGLCNATLWPLFHTMADRATFDESCWEAYVSVNKKFADKAVEALQRTTRENSKKIPLVWIQDYHLLLAGKMIREAAVKKKIQCVLAFFLHIPFPAFDVFKVLPWENDIMDGMLGSDVIGFHHEDYCLNFLDSCDRGMGYKYEKDRQIVERNDGRFVFVKALPISIPYSRFEKMSETASNELSNQKLKVILGVDRLDYTKGLPNRLMAYELFLENYKEHREKVMLLQIAVPSRTDVQEYQDLKEEMDKLVGSINGRFSTAQWSPIRYIYGCVGQSQLAGFYRDCDVALITPLRDGMNLVAKEFVACRNVDKNAGVLILSPFAGAGRSMEEALLVNPYELGNVARTLNRALTMSEEERIIRMKGLKAREATHDVNVWMNNFISTVDSFLESKETLISEHGKAFEEKVGNMLDCKKKYALMLDFDGTLTPLVSHPTLVSLPHGTKGILEKLKARQDIKLAIISGRQVSDVSARVGIEGISYAGSHGNVICYENGKKFEKEFDKAKTIELEKALDRKVVKRFPGSWVENKGHTVCVHMKHITSAENVKDAMKEIDKVATGLNFKTFPGHDSVECKPKNSGDKGFAVLNILNFLYGQDWQHTVGVVYIGDDTTDEDAMKVLKGKGVTMRILDTKASQETAATMTLQSTRSVVHFLHWFHGKLTNKMDITPASKIPRPVLEVSTVN